MYTFSFNLPRRIVITCINRRYPFWRKKMCHDDAAKRVSSIRIGANFVCYSWKLF